MSVELDVETEDGWVEESKTTHVVNAGIRVIGVSDFCGARVGTELAGRHVVEMRSQK